jgi:hypothetical protein
LNINSRNGFYFLVITACAIGWLLVLINLLSPKPETFPVCGIKHVTDYPCPSCGSTRSAAALISGKPLIALYLNPLGIFIGLFLVFVPIWIGTDLIFGGQSFFSIYNHAIHYLKNPFIWIPLALLMLVNWIWNIQKGL